MDQQLVTSIAGVQVGFITDRHTLDLLGCRPDEFILNIQPLFQHPAFYSGTLPELQHLVGKLMTAVRTINTQTQELP